MKLKVRQQLRSKTIEELKNQLQEIKKELFNLYLDHTQGKLKNTRSLFMKRKQIAMIATLLREKEDTHGKSA